MVELRRLGLNSNQFTGRIPKSLCHLQHLTRLWLTGNPSLRLDYAVANAPANDNGVLDAQDPRLSCYSKDAVQELFKLVAQQTTEEVGERLSGEDIPVDQLPEDGVTSTGGGGGLRSQ